MKIRQVGKILKFHENPSSGKRVLLMRTDRQTDMTKQIIAFRSFANAPRKRGLYLRLALNRSQGEDIREFQVTLLNLLV